MKEVFRQDDGRLLNIQGLFVSKFQVYGRCTDKTNSRVELQ